MLNDKQRKTLQERGIIFEEQVDILCGKFLMLLSNQHENIAQEINLLRIDAQRDGVLMSSGQGIFQETNDKVHHFSTLCFKKLSMIAQMLKVLKKREEEHYFIQAMTTANPCLKVEEIKKLLTKAPIINAVIFCSPELQTHLDYQLNTQKAIEALIPKEGDSADEIYYSLLMDYHPLSNRQSVFMID